MKMWQKVAIGAAVAVVGAGIVLYSVNQASKGVTTVQTAKVAKQDTLVSLVTASGEIKPTTYTNVQAQGFGRITEILVKEGDHIQKGQRLLVQDSIQANADVQAQSAALTSSESGIAAAEAITGPRKRTCLRKKPTSKRPSSTTTAAWACTRTV